MQTDSQLIAQFLEGDDQAFEQLVERYQGPVYRMMLGLVGEASDAEELAQDVFVKVYRKLGSFEGRAAFSTWLYRIVQNTAKTFRMKLAIRRTFIGPWTTEGQDQDVPDSRPLYTDLVEASESQKLAEKALEQLPFRAKQILVLREINELAYQEISDILGCSMGTVKSRIFRAKEQLREQYHLITKGAQHGTVISSFSKPESAVSV